MTVPHAEAVFSMLDRELWLLTTRVGERRAGLVVSQVGQASILPEGPRVWVGLSPQHHTTPLVRDGQSFLLHLLRAEHFELAWKFGTRSGHDSDKLAGRTWEESPLGNPRLPGALAWLDCTVESSIETGDRQFFLARVRAAEKLTSDPPLTVQQFQRMLSPAQASELHSRLIRDTWVDADMVRRWQDNGYQPIGIACAAASPESDEA